MSPVAGPSNAWRPVSTCELGIASTTSSSTARRASSARSCADTSSTVTAPTANAMADCAGRSRAPASRNSTTSPSAPVPTSRGSSPTQPIDRRSTRWRARPRSSASTVGPYALYGSELVAAVVEAGGDYCDLTGEVQWMRRMIDAHQSTGRGDRRADRAHVRLRLDPVGPRHLVHAATRHRAVREPCVEVRMSVKGAKGGVSGGTAASGHADVRGDGRGSRAAQGRRRSVRARSGRPPHRSEAAGDRSTDPRDERFDSWVAPFVMAPTNSAVVLRSSCAARRAVGTRLHLRRDDDDRWRRDRGSGRVGDDRRVGDVRRRGEFRADPQAARQGDPEAGCRPERGQAAGRILRPALRRTHRGRPTRSAPRSPATQDPGYGSTAKMLGESAVAFLDLDPADVGGGFWTPASAFGDALVERLEAHAGVRFDVI